jgi:ribosomal protein L36
MQHFRKLLLPALFLGFLFIGLIAFMQSRPSHKNARVYTTVKKFSPYVLEKRFGGLEIINKEDPEFKEKPNNMTLFKEFERLERAWGKKHLKLKGDLLIINDNNGSTLHTLPLQNKDEIEFVHRYYGI